MIKLRLRVTDIRMMIMPFMEERRETHHAHIYLKIIVIIMIVINNAICFIVEYETVYLYDDMTCE